MSNAISRLRDLSPEQRDLLLRRLAKANRKDREPAGKLIPRAQGDQLGYPAESPLSFAQERQWFLDRLSPGDPIYNIPGALRLTGALSIPALSAAFDTILRRHAVLPDERIAAVQTGGCPHTAIRDDITANLDAIDDLIEGNDKLDLILVESGGDNLTATFSSGLVDVQIFVVDVAGGDKVPRKGGPGVTYSDLLVVNKTDLAPMVGADLDVMRRDAGQVRGDRPTVLISLTEDPAASLVQAWVREQLAGAGVTNA